MSSVPPSLSDGSRVPEHTQVAEPASHSKRGSALQAGLDPAQQAILQTILYYNAFRFPLRASELRRLTSHKWDDSGDAGPSLNEALAQLTQSGLLDERSGLFFIGESDQVERRQAGEMGAKRVRKKALARGRMIGFFPFVRAVAFSGSLSKGVHFESDDVDFFVVTSVGRVWLARFFLMSFKKIFLLNSRSFFCVNYLVSEDALEIPDRNLFTATEIVWLDPVCGSTVLQRFFLKNNWVEAYFPAWKPSPATVSDKESGHRLLKGFAFVVEKVLSGGFGNRLDEACRRLIAARNQKRHSHLSDAELPVAMRATRTASKHHPRNMQSRVLDDFAKRVEDFEQKHAVEVGWHP